MILSDLPTSRQEAIEVGSVAYYTGLPCKNGHTDARYTNTGICYQCKRSQVKRDYQVNTDRITRANNESRERNRDRVNKTQREWIANNQDRRRKVIKGYKTRHREKYLAAQREYERKKREDPFYRLSSAISLGIWKFLKQRKDFNKWQSLVDFTLPQLIAHLEAKFAHGMTWENYGTYWEIDHIKPKSKCATLEEAWRLDNLQPLTITENRRKQAKWNEDEVDYPFVSTRL